MSNEGAPVNVGILAHVDAGKTTLTEQMLYLSGAIRSPGRVDDGTAHTDFMGVERARGISVRAASTYFIWNDRQVNLIDTPGHNDFSGEVERALRALDIAVLVLSAVEGVQAQTEVIWDALRALGIPAILFINKTDRTGADAQKVLAEVRTLPGARPVMVSAVSSLNNLSSVNFSDFESFVETDDVLLEKYLAGDAENISPKEIASAFFENFYASKIQPVLCGAALKGEGVRELLDLIASFACDGNALAADPVSGVVFKLEHDDALGKVAYVRLYRGTLNNRDAVRYPCRDAQDKVVQIRKVRGQKDVDQGTLAAGDIGAVYGLSSVRSGDVIGTGEGVPGGIALAAPMLRISCVPADAKDLPVLAEALEKLSAEDPLLGVVWEKETRELSVRVTGLIQIEVLKALLLDRFSLEITTGDPQIIYKERPVKKGEGFVEYTMPKPCWAVMRFLIEPLPLGAGVVFESTVHNDKIYKRYQSQVAQTIPEALRQGPKGWEVTDLKITLIDGEHHTVHTHPLDFALATPMGVMDGLVNTGTELLEPVMKYRLTFPEEYSGKIVGEILSMRGRFDSPVIKGASVTMEGFFPAATSMDFPIRLASLTGGRAALNARFHGYEVCPPGEGKETPYVGVSPLDRAKYILYKRGAI